MRRNALLKVLAPLLALSLALTTGGVVAAAPADGPPGGLSTQGRGALVVVPPQPEDDSSSRIPPAIQPHIIEPEDGANVYGDVEVWATELVDPSAVAWALFEYSPNGSDWYDIGTDYDGTVEAKSVDMSSSQWGIWSHEWSIGALSEGWYHLRVTMAGTADEIVTGQDEVQVYVDPTPPVPQVTAPTLAEDLIALVSGPTTFEAVTADEDVVCMTVELLQPTPSIHVDSWWWPWYWEKGVPEKDQHDYGPLKGEPKDSQKWKDDTSCGPTSAGSSLWYWATKHPDVYGNLTKEGGTQLNQTQVVDKLHGYTKTVERSPKTGGEGVSDPNMVSGIREWIADHGGGLNVTYVKKADFTFQKYVTELLKCEDLLVSTDRHWMTGNSVSFPKNADGTYDVDFMDPWAGNYTTVKMKKNGDFTKYGRPKDTMIMVSPTAEKEEEVLDWILLGLDCFGEDGWTVPWDPTGFDFQRYYVLRVTMTDDNERSASDMVLVYLGEAPPAVGGSILPADKMALLMPWIVGGGALMVFGAVWLALWNGRRRTGGLSSR